MTRAKRITPCTHAEYLAMPELGRSAIVEAKKGRMAEWHQRHNLSALPPEPETAAMILGTAVHAAVLEPERFAAEYVPVAGAKTRAAKAYRDAVAGAPIGHVVLPSPEYDHACDMAAAVLRSPHYRWLDGADTEVTILWDHEETGLPCKARLDAIAEVDGQTWVVDLKTTSDIDPGKFIGSCWRYGYAEQCAHYIDAAMAIGLEVAGFMFVVVDKAKPHTVRAYRAADELIQAGFRRRDEALARIADCSRTNDWTEAADHEPVVIGEQEVPFD